MKHQNLRVARTIRFFTFFGLMLAADGIYMAHANEVDMLNATSENCKLTVDAHLDDASAFGLHRQNNVLNIRC